MSVGSDWTLVLEPDRYGWVGRLLGADGVDLSRITPPLHGPNPRELHGWHFRNSANTGPNKGDVNAPQRLRRFLFAGDIAPDWPRSGAAEPVGRV